MTRSKFESASTRAEIDSDGIVYTYLKAGENVTVEDAKAQHDWVMEQCDGEPHYLIGTLEFGSTVDPEVREWARSPERVKYVAADAWVVNTLAHKLLANFYLKYNKPNHPTKVFSSAEKARVWIKEQMAKTV